MTHNVVEISNDDLDNDDLLLEEMQQKRMAIISSLSPTPTAVPADNEDRKFLREMMNDVTATVLNKKRIKSQDRANTNREQLVQALVTGALKEIKSTGNPFEIGTNSGTIDVTPQVPDTFDPDFVAVPGETDNELHQFEYRAFMSATEHLDKPKPVEGKDDSDEESLPYLD